MTPQTAKEWARYYWENNSLVEGAEPNWIRLTECFDQAMSQARDQVLEEAANKCDELFGYAAPKQCADRIRSLKSKPDQKISQPEGEGK